ncbi:acetyltransferase [Vibrio cholerae]|nr:acetyltransferase [Vibrio cholerae]TQP76709.1 acetyltransferase [Vibrio cholerae]TQP88428.1 acetyltransferase [Vibrio cholerae]TQQ63189.1 acetyltransferase [Vibrio cholerae]
MQLLCLSLVVMRCQPLRRALTLICIYINIFNRLTDF